MRDFKTTFPGLFPRKIQVPFDSFGIFSILKALPFWRVCHKKAPSISSSHTSPSTEATATCHGWPNISWKRRNPYRLSIKTQGDVHSKWLKPRRQKYKGHQHWITFESQIENTSSWWAESTNGKLIAWGWWFWDSGPFLFIRIPFMKRGCQASKPPISH